MQKLLLVDFENVQQVDLTRLDESFQVVIFVGATQKNVPLELVQSAQPLGPRIEWRQVDGNGRNALDFFIACHLGRVLEESPQVQCIILSKDKGFDALLRHLNKLGLRCKRLESLEMLDPKPPVQPEDSNYDRVLELLTKQVARARPGNRKSLNRYIAALFQNILPPAEVDRLVDLLFSTGVVSESNNVLTYKF